MRTTLYWAIQVACAVALLGLTAHADAIQFKDGRHFVVSKINKVEGGYELVFGAGKIFVKEDLVNTVLMSDASGGFIAKNEEDKAKLAKGLVPYKGKWIAKDKAEKQIAKDAAAAKKAMEEAKKHQLWRNRYQKKTKHFAFEYTIPNAKALEYMDLMERYYATFMKKWRIKVAKDMPKLKVCFYHDQEYYYQVSGAPRGAIGYFRFVAPIEANFYYDRNDERLTLDVMFHETNHYLTYLINPKFNYPAWVNESLAEYYGASKWDKEKKKVTVGHLQEGRLVVLMDAIAGTKPPHKAAAGKEMSKAMDKWLGLEKMIRMERFSALHYAWGWSFVHYLMSNKKYSKRFQKFYIALGKDKKVTRVPYMGRAMTMCKPDEQIRVLKAYLGVKDLKKLERGWHEYVGKLKLTSHRGYEEAAQWAENWGLTIRAGRYYRTAIEKGTKNPLTFDNYGEWCMRKSKTDDAIANFKKAIELDPMNAWFHLHMGQALIEKGDKEAGERKKKLALELEPNDAWLAFAAGKPWKR